MSNTFKSVIFDGINKITGSIQEKTDVLRQKSIILSNLDVFVLIFLILTLILSTFASTSQIGAVSIFVPIIVFIKFLITKGERVELERWNFCLLIYFIICFISNFTSSLPHQSFYGFTKTFVYICFYFALCQFFKNNKKFIPLIFFIVACLISAEGIIGLFQNSLGLENISTWQDTSYVNPEDVLSRVYGTLKPYNPNLLAGYIIAGFPSLLALTVLYFKSGRVKTTLISVVLTLITAFTLCLTGCRAAYMAMLSIIICVGIFSHKLIFKNGKSVKAKKLWNLSASCFSIFIVLFMTVNHGIFKRLTSVFLLRGDSSTSFRMNVYNSAIRMFSDNPICGIGCGNKVFREIYGLYMVSGFDALSCYCVFLEHAVESGIFALIAYLFFLFLLLKSGIDKLYKTDDFGKKIIVAAGVSSVIAVTVHGFADTIYFRPQVQYLFWTMVAIITACLKYEEKSEYENTRISG